MPEILSVEFVDSKTYIKGEDWGKIYNSKVIVSNYKGSGNTALVDLHQSDNNAIIYDISNIDGEINNISQEINNLQAEFQQKIADLQLKLDILLAIKGKP